MPTVRPEVTVGLVPQGGTGWIAGVIYLENIVRAVLAMSGNRVEFCFVESPERQLGPEGNLTLGVPVYRYTHRSHHSWSQAAWNSVKLRRPPLSLETLADRIGLSVLFPLQTPPCEELPVPWIGWIPDLQHKRRPEFFSDAHRADRDIRFRRIVDEAAHVVVSSQDARADLMRWFPTTDARVSVLQFRTVLDRRTQIQIMRASAAVVQASFFEGWSALVEDSRALGKRIFVSDIPVHREQDPVDAAYFNPESAEELADLIEAEWPHLEPGPDLGRELRAREAQERLTRDFACRFVDVVGHACRAT